MNKKNYLKKLLVATLAFGLFTTVPAFGEEFHEDLNLGDPQQVMDTTAETSTDEDSIDEVSETVTAPAPTTPAPVAPTTAAILEELDEDLRDLVHLSFGQLRAELARRGIRLTAAQQSALHRARLAIILDATPAPVAPQAPATPEEVEESEYEDEEYSYESGEEDTE